MSDALSTDDPCGARRARIGYAARRGRAAAASDVDLRVQVGFGEKRQYDYTRSGNPTRDALGEALAALEGGAGGVVTASGMAAVQLVTPAARRATTC